MIPIPDQIRASKVVLFAESGLLAGDLAAWLSGHFSVERATSVAGALQALRQQAGALVVVEGEGIGDPHSLDELVRKSASQGTRMIILGMDLKNQPPSWKNLVVHLSAIPSPGDLFDSLKNLPPRADQARG